MNRIHKLFVVAIPVAAFIFFFLGSSQPAAAQGGVIIPEIDCQDVGENFWCRSSVTVTWNLEEGAEIIKGCQTEVIDFETAGYPVYCEAIVDGLLHTGGGGIKVDFTAPEPGCNVMPGDVLNLNEGDELPLDCSGSNDNLSAVTATFDTNEDGIFGDEPVFYAIDGSTTPCFITILLEDEAGNQTEFTVEVFVANVAPIVKIDDVVASDGTFNIGGQIDMFVSVDDPGVNDSHTILIDWGDGDSFAGSLTPCFIKVYNQPGTFTVTVTVYDNDGAASVPVSTEITIDDPEDTLGEIEYALIEALGAGVYNNGQANSLGAQMDAAENSLANSNYEAASGQLSAFAYHGITITDPAAVVTPCFNVALEIAEALWEGWVGPPD